MRGSLAVLLAVVLAVLLAAPVVPALASSRALVQGGTATAPPPSPSAERWWSEAVEQAVARAGDNATEWRIALARVPAAQRDGLAFLLEHMGERDLRSLDAEFLLENTALAYEALAEAPWREKIPPDVFLNDVLPYAQVTEPRDPWRRELRAHCLPLCAGCATPSEAAQRLNERIFQDFGVRYSTERRRADQSPKQSIEGTTASCTGLSILLADACRAVGVPARLCGTPSWADKRGNHTWVEVWDGGWHFTGACEPDPRGLDHGWFEGDAARAQRGSRRHAIYAVSYRPTGTTFPLVWARDALCHAVDVTDHYAKPAAAEAAEAAEPAPSARLLVAVLDRAGGRRIRAEVTVTDAEDPDVTFAGESKGERFDQNDLLEFAVPAGRTYRVRVAASDLARTVSVTPGDVELVRVALTADEPDTEEPDADELDDAFRAVVTAWFTAPEEERAGITFDEKLEKLLARDDARARRLAWQAYRTAPIHDARREDFAAHRVRTAERQSPYTVKEVGKKPDSGWPLCIAMHGGGGVQKRVNDSQWVQMQSYYKDQHGVPGYLYLALRAPNDQWNGFYDNAIAPLVAELIGQLLLFGDVDPDKVFLIGYSHGGYGAFGIGPKIADRFAAVHASAAAPTPGITAAANLRSTVFTYMVGERDNAYGRRERCEAFDKEIAELRGDRDDVYPVTMELIADNGHRGLPDRDRIAKLYPHVRNPVPREVTWEPTGPEVKDFFWLRMDPPRGTVTATCRDNVVSVEAASVESGGAEPFALSLGLDARLVDFGRPVEIRTRIAGQAKTATRELRPSLATLCQSLLERGDPQLAYTARVEILPGR